jgi:LysR family transcriptional activator of nhaA
MRDLNYHHLRYFWVVAREGTIARACERLHVAQPTISGQLRELERAVGDKLFTRVGRHLQLTPCGRTVLGYCDEIFALGRELGETLDGRTVDRQAPVVIGISDAVSKLIAYRLIEPALRLPAPVPLRCLEDRPDRLFAALAVHDLDVVICDQPLGTQASVRAYSHLLGESGVAIFAGPEHRRLKKGFPRSLDGAPILLPGQSSVARRTIDAWCDAEGIRPRLIGEFQDMALLAAFGRAGAGVFPAPAVLADEVREMYGAEPIGAVTGARERYYAISIERRLSRPAVVAISQAARRALDQPRRR